MVLSGDLSQTLIRTARLTLRAFTAADAAASSAEATARIATYVMEFTRFRDGASGHIATTDFRYEGRKGVVFGNSPYEHE